LKFSEIDKRLLTVTAISGSKLIAINTLNRTNRSIRLYLRYAIEQMAEAIAIDRHLKLSISHHATFMFDQDSVKVSFPWVAYISQPLDHPTVKLILNPIKFKKLYRIWLLEMCLTREVETKNYQH
jgi:hypothetical protein